MSKMSILYHWDEFFLGVSQTVWNDYFLVFEQGSDEVERKRIYRFLVKTDKVFLKHRILKEIIILGLELLSEKIVLHISMTPEIAFKLQPGNNDKCEISISIC